MSGINGPFDLYLTKKGNGQFGATMDFRVMVDTVGTTPEAALQRARDEFQARMGQGYGPADFRLHDHTGGEADSAQAAEPEQADSGD